ncbi:aldose epimerase family protein [Virgibacillus dokdonensis]|uniref:aldose epimerase family protein n=1 Tax=Virgibacillus dokdonensis TaxID=302167 RepID=UPI00098AF34B|nr:aldose epimerase family protein [Virgibacillus dokdonensis]
MEIKEKTVHTNWKLRTLINDNHMQISFLDYGGAITEIVVPDKQGQLDNVVLHYNHYQDYEANPFYLGALIGRVAGRIANASFLVKGKRHFVTKNEGHHHLHGGINGFSHVLWHVTTEQTEKDVRAILTHHSPDGDNGYPGNVKVTISYILTNENTFTIDYKATTDQATPIALTNHSYFNLRGSKGETVKQHYAKMKSDICLELNKDLIPTGRFITNAHAFNFQSYQQLCTGMNANHEQNSIAGNGYDHYFCFAKEKDKQACLLDKKTGRTLHVTTNQPGMILYTGNYLHESHKQIQTTFSRYQGVCLETQGSPVALIYKHLPSIMLEPNEIYHQTTAFSFGIKG